MASRQASEISFSLSGVRERMREKKNGALRTAKLNASLASKIRTKIINNSSTIKISLKHNNKALALALNAEKASAQRLTQEKMILQKEVEQCHFESAVLRHKLSFLNNTLKEIENLAAGAKMAWLPEFCTSSASLSNGQKSSMTEDSWANDIADGQLVRAAGMLLRVPISKLCDAGQEGGSSTAVQTERDRWRSTSNEPLETLAVASKDTLPPAAQPQSHQEENGKKLTETMEAQETFRDSDIFGEALCITQQEPNNLPALAWESHPSSYEGNEMAKDFFDRLSQGHITERRKRSTLFATSTPSSVVDIIPHVISTQAAGESITKDSSSSSKRNTQPQLKSPSSLVSPTQTTVIPDRKSLTEEIFCDQPQAKEMGCGVEMNPRYSRVPEFVPVKVKSKGNCKTVEKKTVKASRGKKPNAITKNAESSLDLPQNEDSALQPKGATCSSESEVSEMRQKACVRAFNSKNRGCGVERDSCSADEVQDLRRKFMVNPAQPQAQSLQSSDLLQQVTKEAIFEIQSVDSLSKSSVGTFSSHEVPSDDCSLQNSLFLRKDTSGACALQDSSGSTKSIKQKTNRRTGVAKQRDESENLPNNVKTPGAKDEEQPKRSLTSRNKTVRKSSCNNQRNGDVLGTCVDVQREAKESMKDSTCNLKRSRKTDVVCTLDCAGNLGCVQTYFEGNETVPHMAVPGRKPSKIPRFQSTVAAQSNKKQTGDLQKKQQAKADNKSALKEDSYPKLKPHQKRNTSSPPEADLLARQRDGTKTLIASSAELASKQPPPIGKFSCITDLLSDPDAFLKEQIAERSLENNLMRVLHSLESSSVLRSAARPVSSKLTDVSVSKSLSTEGNRMTEKSFVWQENSLILKEMPQERNQFESSSWSSHLEEPEIMQLQDLTNTRTLPFLSSEEELRRSARQKRNTPCYAEPKINRKLRQGDPFTDMEFFYYDSHHKTKKKTVKVKGITKKAEDKKHLLLGGCPSAKSSQLITVGRDMEAEVK